MRLTFTFLFSIIVFVNSTFAENDLTILIVHDNDNTPVMTDSMRNAVTAAGYNYVDYDAVANGAPTVDDLTPYELVIWATGKDGSSRFWNGDLPNDGIKSYLDNGGMLWLEGLDFMYDLVGSAPDTFRTGDFVYDYLGVEIYAAQSYANDGSQGLPMMVVEDGNGICTTDTVRWRWSTMWYADAVVPTPNAQSIYKMGPSDYALADTSCMVYNEKGDAKILSAFIRWDGFATYNLGVELTTQILDYFNQYSTATTIDVSSIEITSSTDFTISENNGTLQLGVTVLPTDATISTVSWSIKDGSVPATISESGLLTASGVDNGNGVVTVMALADDGSGIKDSVDVTISNQTLGGGFSVLLVNDDLRDYTKHLDIDTALNEGGFTYKIYDIADSEEVPDYDYLSNFDFVIWDMARDGVNVNFWDVSDSSAIQCNSDLKEYADNGGTVWALGRDFMYDIWKGLNTVNADGDSVIAAFDAGDFVYDYLGISYYVGQTHLNEPASSAFDGVEQLDITEENDITTIDPIEWTYSSVYYAEIIDVTENAVPLYYMGPATYDFSLFYAMVYNQKDDAKFITSTFNPSDIDTQDNLNLYVKEVLDYFEALPTSTNQIAKSEDFELSTYPNPTANKTYINYTLPSNADVKLAVYDVTGKLVFNEDLGFKLAGKQNYELSVTNFEEGIYFYQLTAGNSTKAQRLIVVK